jgi:hypothetical protein
MWFKRFKRRRKSTASEPEKGVFVGSVVAAQYKPLDQRAAEDAAVAEFNRAMSPGLRQPGPIRHHSPFTSKPGRQGTGL